MKEIEEKSNEEIPGSWIGKLNIVKMAVFPNMIYRFITISIIIKQVILWILTN
jgi:hypothetical protein